MVDQRHQPWLSPPNFDIALPLLLLAARIVNALAVKTFFQPDEYFQSLEPAWRSAFGEDSGAWITWEWREGLRSSAHPLLFAGIYRSAAWIGQVLQLNPTRRADVLVAAPKVGQAVCAALVDWYTYRLAIRTYGADATSTYAALFLMVASPWQAFASVRTFSNSLETLLTIMALALWPWQSFAPETVSRSGISKRDAAAVRSQDLDATELFTPLLVAAWACILRPTNIIIWVAATFALLARSGTVAKLVTLAQAGLLAGGTVFATSIATDTSFYGSFVIPQWRFLKFNVVQSLAVFYGRNRPDYYLTEGLPLLLTTALPFAAVGLWHGLRRWPRTSDIASSNERTIRHTLAVAVLATVAMFSLIAHKEVRFIYPLLPMLHVLAAKPVASFFAPFPYPRSKLKRTLLVAMLCVNVTIGWYTVFVHQRGVIDVMHYLRHQHEAKMTTPTEPGLDRYEGDSTTVGVLMPCHSTPWRSHLVHAGIHAWALTCEPPLNLTTSERDTYMDEADVFYDHPSAWLANNMGNGLPDSRQWPEYLVFFAQLEPTLTPLLESEHRALYQPAWRGFNTHWHDDWRRRGDVIVWRRNS